MKGTVLVFSSATPLKKKRAMSDSKRYFYMPLFNNVEIKIFLSSYSDNFYLLFLKQEMC